MRNKCNTTNYENQAMPMTNTANAKCSGSKFKPNFLSILKDGNKFGFAAF